MTEISVWVGSVPTDRQSTGPTIDSRRLRRELVRLQRTVDELSELRWNLRLDSATHQTADRLLPNFIASVAVVQGLQWLAGVAQVDDWLELSSCDTALATTAPPFSFDGTQVSPWWYRAGALADGSNQAQPSRCVEGSRGLRAAFTMLNLDGELSPLDNRTAFLRLLDGILATLSLMLVLVLAALARHLDVLTFVLVMLAVCLRYGHRGEPDAHAFLPMRRNQTSLGSGPHS